MEFARWTAAQRVGSGPPYPLRRLERRGYAPDQTPSDYGASIDLEATLVEHVGPGDEHLQLLRRPVGSVRVHELPGGHVTAEHTGRPRIPAYESHVRVQLEPAWRIVERRDASLVLWSVGKQCVVSEA